MLLLKTKHELWNLLRRAIRSKDSKSLQSCNFDEEWELFKDSYKKKYSGTEEEHKKANFMVNLARIVDHNTKIPRPSYAMGLNNYSDILADVFYNNTSGFIGNDQHLREMQKKKRIYGIQKNMVPEKFDWREKGVVTKVSDQGAVKTCWAFSAAGALEAQQCIKTGSLIQLSKQQLIDCSREYGNEGCDGGRMDDSFRYLINCHGLSTEASYPYNATDGPCQCFNSTVGARCTGYVRLAYNDEEDLLLAVSSIRPICVGIDIAFTDFFHYSSGIYCGPGFNSRRVELTKHSMLVVGYDCEKGTDYWIVKNSWGINWGEDGYIRIKRNKNLCRIAQDSCYPLVS